MSFLEMCMHLPFFFFCVIYYKCEWTLNLKNLRGFHKMLLEHHFEHI